MESNLIIDALRFYIAQVEKYILQMEKDGKTSIFAPGFYTNKPHDFKEKLRSMTKKAKTSMKYAIFEYGRYSMINLEQKVEMRLVKMVGIK